MFRKAKRSMLGLLALVVLVAVPAIAAQPAKQSLTAQPEDAVRSTLSELQSALSSQNANDVLKLFADDATFIDEAGEQIKGKADLQKRFEQLFKSGGGTGMGIHPQQISFPAPNVALAVGEVSRKSDQSLAPVSRFAMVMTKPNNQGWRINQITESAMRQQANQSRLQELNWMIGQWKADSKSSDTAQLSVEWTPNKNFITSKYTLNKPGLPAQVDLQIIGWDPQTNSIVSWHFDSNGGFGRGAWVKAADQEKWVVQVTGVGADGTSTIASNVFALKKPTEFVWQSINRSIDGQAVSDTEPVSVRRQD